MRWWFQGFARSRLPMSSSASSGILLRLLCLGVPRLGFGPDANHRSHKLHASHTPLTRGGANRGMSSAGSSMKRTVMLLAAVGGLSALAGCVGYVPVAAPGYYGGPRYHAAPPPP